MRISFMIYQYLYIYIYLFIYYYISYIILSYIYMQINLQAKEHVAYVYESHGTNSWKIDSVCKILMYVSPVDGI